MIVQKLAAVKLSDGQVKEVVRNSAGQVTLKGAA
jgi:hypothetical protein